MTNQLISTDQWLAAAKHRRSVYDLKNTSAVTDNRVEEILKEILSFSPSSYNTQPVRVTLITGEKHRQFWDLIIEHAEPMLKGVSEEVWVQMSGLMTMHKGAYGSILFWERGQTTIEAAAKHQSAAHMFPQFGEHAQGIFQILVWTALELEGVGANLQHMNAIPPVVSAVRAFCGVPDDYELKGHLNYGDEAQAHPEVPEKLPFSETLKVIS
ncbi:hypothetical protein ACHAPO_009622 [Fusarium lateritium]